jgi:uncharacterized membrane protein
MITRNKAALLCTLLSSVVIVIASMRHPQCLANKNHYASCVVGTSLLGIPLIMILAGLLFGVLMLGSYVRKQFDRTSE